MSDAADRFSAPQGSAALRDYCLRVIRFLAATALDPHRYFEQKYCGDVSASDTDDDLVRILVILADWCRETQTTTTGLTVFDRVLRADGLPSFSMICDSETRPAGLVLATGRITTAEDSQVVRDFLHAAAADNADRPIAELRLSEYEQRR